jgi:hypothetical protein
VVPGGAILSTILNLFVVPTGGGAIIGGFSVKATREEGQVVAGKDAPIDVTVTPAAGWVQKVADVRFWIGTQVSKGVKA